MNSSNKSAAFPDDAGILARLPARKASEKNNRFKGFFFQRLAISAIVRGLGAITSFALQEPMMTDTPTSSVLPAVDVSAITDADTRRAIRSMCQQVAAVLDRQQKELEAMLDVLTEKHLTSVGEFKRHLLKVQQRDRIHEAIAAPQVTTNVRPQQPQTRQPEPTEHKRYYL
jgi:hypothetical protein